MEKGEIEKLYRFYMINYDKPTVSKYVLMQFIYELYEKWKEQEEKIQFPESEVGKVCSKCNGKGYFEYETGVIHDAHGAVREFAKDICECQEI